jgi:uncharacterized protein YbjQ (UPF0145 family)
VALDNDESLDVLLTTTEALPGYEIEDVMGLVAGIHADVDGALTQLERYAAERGATAVVGVRLSTSASGGAFIASHETVAYGTAVVTRPLTGSSG